MDAKYLFYITLVISVIVQIITGVIEIGAFFVQVPTIYLLIRQLLMIELIVQFLEGMFYVWLAYNFTKVINVTPKRYIDWCITTPSMLLTLMLYLIYLNKKVENKTDELEFFTLLKENATIFIPVLCLNWLMLFFGYLGEMKRIPVLLGVFLGFIPFLIYYYIIYKKYALSSNDDGLNIFFYFFIIWSLYGIVAVLPYKIKNMCYNILDLFSKNFFGIFLSYLLFTNV